MADKDNNVYAFKVKEEHTQQAATEAERQRGWSPELNAANPIWAVKVSQLGWVRGAIHDNGTWANVQLLGDQRYVWIPRRCIDLGAVKGMQKDVYIPGWHDNVKLHNAPSALSRCIGTLFQEMGRESDTLCDAGAALHDIQALSRNSDYMEAILKGMDNVKTRPLFNDGQPTWEKLWSLPHIQTNDNLGGIYALLYWIQADDQTVEKHIYIGKSVNISQRYSQHRGIIMGSSEIKASKNHYGTARLAARNGGFRAVKIAQWNLDALPNQMHSDALLKIAEHTITTLCYSWNPKLLKSTSDIVAFGRYARSWKAAQVFSILALRIFKATGWKLSGISGLNWSTPLTESQTHERTIWVGTFLPPSREYLPGKTLMKIFRRPGVRITSTPFDYKGVTIYFVMLQHRSHSGDQTSLHFGISAKIMERCGLEPGQTVYPAVEIMLNGKSHATPYARLPAIGPFPDWPNLNSMAVILEYESKTDGWKSIPLENTQFFGVAAPLSKGAKFPEAAPYLSAVYCRTSALIGGLMRYKYTGPLPNWAPETSRFRVLDTFWDHYNQRIETSPAKPWSMVPPRVLTRDEVSKSLDATYKIQHGDGSETRLAMGKKPAGIFKGAGMGSGKERESCDLCFLANLHHQDVFVPPTSNYVKEPKCTSAKTGADTCVRCSRLNRPCTWTSRTNMIERGWTTLGVSKALRLQPRSIPTPSSSRDVQELGSNDHDAGEDEGEGEDEDGDMADYQGEGEDDYEDED